MAHLKKNQMNQVMFVMVDATDFATIESGVNPASVTGKFFGVNHGGSTAMTSGTISKSFSTVRSGIFRATLKASECNYDFLLLRFTESDTGSADQILTFTTRTYDDSDIYSLLSDFNSDFGSRVPKAVATNSQVSDLISDVKSLLTNVDSQLLLVASDTSDILSEFNSRVPKLVATQSQLVSVLSDISDVYSLLTNVDSQLLVTASDVSDLTSRITKEIVTQSRMSDYHSDLRSLTSGITATVSASSISDIASRVWSEKYTAHSAASSFGSLMSDIYSKAGATLSASDLSDIASAVISNINATGVNLKTGQTASWASALEASAGTILERTVDTATNTHTPTTTEFQADDETEGTADHFIGRIVIFTSGNLQNQATDIVDYEAVGGIGQFTVTAMTEAPANNDTFVIV